VDFEREKKWIANRVICRCQSFLLFLQEYLPESGGTDFAYSRSRYLLMSFGTELLLKSLMVLSSKAKTLPELDEELREPLHNLEMAWNSVDAELVREVGIVKVERRENINLRRLLGAGDSKKLFEYVVETTTGAQIVVQDFLDVRYDFMQNATRNGDTAEVSQMRQDLQELLVIVGKIVTKTEFEPVRR
jgi:hypothetical protein